MLGSQCWDCSAALSLGLPQSPVPCSDVCALDPAWAAWQRMVFVSVSRCWCFPKHPVLFLLLPSLAIEIALLVVFFSKRFLQLPLYVKCENSALIPSQFSFLISQCVPWELGGLQCV